MHRGNREATIWSDSMVRDQVTIVSHLAMKLLNSFLFLSMQLNRFYVTQNRTGGALNWISTARDAGKMLHERKVMQNLSNATTKIQLNSIPEKKTSKRETFFSSYLGNAQSDTEKKDMKLILKPPSCPCTRVLALLFLHASFFPFLVFRLFHLFLLSIFSSPIRRFFSCCSDGFDDGVRREVAENHRQFSCLQGLRLLFNSKREGKVGERTRWVVDWWRSIVKCIINM